MRLQRTACLIAAIAALVACPPMARADDTQVSRHPFAIEFGTYFPTNGNAQQFIHTVYALQVNYDLEKATAAAAPLSVYGQYGWGSHAPVSGGERRLRALVGRGGCANPLASLRWTWSRVLWPIGDR
jgi:hypothetical protein